MLNQFWGCFFHGVKGFGQVFNFFFKKFGVDEENVVTLQIEKQ